MNDYNSYYESMGYDYEAAKRRVEADKASTALMVKLFTFIFKLCVTFFVFLPGIFSAYFILIKFEFSQANLRGWHYWAAWAILVYFIECSVFFIKGWFIGLKENGNRWWTILWAICALYCFVLPLVLFHLFILDSFKPAPGHPTNTLNTISWIGGALISAYIYSRYKLHKDIAPPMMSWSYRIGYRVVN